MGGPWYTQTNLGMLKGGAGLSHTEQPPPLPKPQWWHDREGVRGSNGAAAACQCLQGSDRKWGSCPPYSPEAPMLQALLWAQGRGSREAPGVGTTWSKHSCRPRTGIGEQGKCWQGEGSRTVNRVEATRAVCGHSCSRSVSKGLAHGRRGPCWGSGSSSFSQEVAGGFDAG